MGSSSSATLGKIRALLPKFDSVQEAEHLPIQDSGPFRVLVATANTPAFDSRQRVLVLQSLQAINKRLQNNPLVNGRKLEITWRLTDGIDTELGIEQNQSAAKSIPISDAIELADAVITTPSTLYLESAMKRRPTAVLDFSNSPQYVGSAWTISAPIHLNPVLEELENPPPSKLLFQRSVLHDNLELGVSARSRLYALIDVMIKAGQAAKRDGTKISLPTRVLSDPQRGIQRVESDFNPAILYRDNPCFKINEIERLQQELNQAVARLGQLPRDLDTKHAGNHVLAKQVADAEARITAGLKRENQHLALVEQKTEIISRKSEHIGSLEKHYQEANARAKELRAQVKELRIENRKISNALKAFQKVANKPQSAPAQPSVTPEAPPISQPLPRIQMPISFPMNNASTSDEKVA